MLFMYNVAISYQALYYQTPWFLSDVVHHHTPSCQPLLSIIQDEPPHLGRFFTVAPTLWSSLKKHIHSYYLCVLFF